MIDILQRYVFAHFGYKVVSLALAVGLWWAVSHDPVAEVEVTVPIEFHRVPASLEISCQLRLECATWPFMRRQRTHHCHNDGRSRGNGRGQGHGSVIADNLKRQAFSR